MRHKNFGIMMFFVKKNQQNTQKNIFIMRRDCKIERTDVYLVLVVKNYKMEERVR